MSPPCIEQNENTSRLLHNLGIFNERNQGLRGAGGGHTAISLTGQSRSSLQIASVAALLRNDRRVGEWRMEGWKDGRMGMDH
jgi:hypothetical protein